MRIVFISFFFLLTAAASQAQFHYYCDSIRFDSHVVVGDTALIATFRIGGGPAAGCHCALQIGWVPMYGVYSVLNGQDQYTSDGINLYFSPENHQPIPVLPNLSLAIACDGVRQCASHSPYYYFSIRPEAVSDSFPKIRPAGWALGMKQDLRSAAFAAQSAPTFDNNISDTTLFSDFSIAATNGASVILQVLDSITPITQYLAMPFARKKPLNLVFSSPNYKSFDTVIFWTRIRHHNVDSVISYRLPVTWEAPAAVHAESRGIQIASHVVEGRFVLSFTLDQPQAVSLNMYDALGREVFTQSNGLGAGRDDLTISTADFPSGVYFYVLRGNGWSWSGKVVKSVLGT